MSGSGVTSLSLAMVAGAVVFAPFLAGGAGPVLTDGRLALAVVGVGVLVYLVLPIFIVVPMSFSGSRFLSFPPPSLSRGRDACRSAPEIVPS